MFKFKSNGDGTCYVKEYSSDTTRELVIPEYSKKGDRVTRIGNYAFGHCFSLVSITIPNSIISIGDSAFYWCRSLKSITIPDSVTSIGKWAFYGCTSLNNITIPSSVTYIGKWAFNNTALKKEIAIKATDGNITCRDFQFNIGNWYHEKRAILCETGFHYVENAFDVFNYYYGSIGNDVRFFKVKTDGVSPERQGDSKRVCVDICLYEEITSYSELLN